MTGETIMSIIYGIDVMPINDPYLAALEELNAAISQAAMGGTSS
jgi:hypothetical protein